MSTTSIVSGAQRELAHECSAFKGFVGSNALTPRPFAEFLTGLAAAGSATD